MRNIRIFIRKFSFFGDKIFSMFELACFRNDIRREVWKLRREHMTEGTFCDVLLLLGKLTSRLVANVSICMHELHKTFKLLLLYSC